VRVESSTDAVGIVTTHSKLDRARFTPLAPNHTVTRRVGAPNKSLNYLRGVFLYCFLWSNCVSDSFTDEESGAIVMNVSNLCRNGWQNLD